MQIAILALQGNFVQHCQILKSLNHSNLSIHFIKSLKDFDRIKHSLDAFILPGGESVTISKLLQQQFLFDPIKAVIKAGLPVLATCAGAILLAKKNIFHKEKQCSIKSFELIDIDIERNAYGKQFHSFSAQVPFTPHSAYSQELSFNTINGVFIRAPIISSYDSTIEVLSRFRGTPVIVQKNTILISTFHPEALNDKKLHQYFIDSIVSKYCK